MKLKKLNHLAVICFLILSLFISCNKDSKKRNIVKLDTGEIYHGFKFIKEQEIKEYDALGRLFIHQKSGARLLKVETDDDNKTFAIAFKTPPLSDCGTPHILEHSVLNGSKNFPVKSPFDVLYKGSLQTFLNAMTGSDITMYPVSSRNNKDYKNLMNVYLDAVFFPLIHDDPRIFAQEGWHYELDSKDSDLTYKGVVYNEMKGSFSTPSRELSYVVSKNLFPDTCYGFSSGGYPTAIPTLTYEQFKNFHQRYYHPVNSYIMVYGDYNVLDELEFIDREYLSKFEKIEINSKITLQETFGEMKEVVADYPISLTGNDVDQTYLNLSFVTGLGEDRNLSMAMEILSSTLITLPGAPVRRALQDAGIGKEVRSYSDNTKQMSFSLTVEKANPEDKDRFKEVVFETLNKVVKDGLDKKVVEGLINRMEFRLREPRGGFKGLILGMNAFSGWMYADDPFLTIQYKPQIEKLRESLKTDYLEKLIQEKLIDNPHSLLTVLKPMKGLMEENLAKVKQELADYKASLSDEELEKIVTQTKELKEYQKTPDTKEALDKIPLLSLEDITPRTDYYKITKQQIDGLNYLLYPTFSNDIIYTKMIFDASVVPQELIPYASLLANVLGKLNTKNHTYGDLDTQINIHTGGINTRMSVYFENQDTQKILPKFVIEGKAMNYKVKEFLQLCKEITVNSKLNDAKRLKEVLVRHQANLEAQVERNGLGVALTRLASYYSNAGQYEELSRGLTYYKFITQLTKDFDTNSKDIILKLIQTAKLLLNKVNLEIAITASQEDIDNSVKEIGVFKDSLLNEEVKPLIYQFSFTNKNEGITSSSKVQYVVQGFDFKQLGYEYSGKMIVLNQILSTDYLHEKIRVMGGAYGGFSSISQDGTVYFGSYRDPNLTETLEHYKNTVQFLENFAIEEKEMTRFIIGTMSRFERPYTAQMKGDSALENYYESITEEQGQRIRQEILTTTVEEIKNLAKMISEILAKDYFCVYGNESKLTQAGDIFSALIKAKE